MDLLQTNNDCVFEKLIGLESYKRVMVCFLNAIFNGEPHIKDVAFDPADYKSRSQNWNGVGLEIEAVDDNENTAKITILWYNTGNINKKSDFPTDFVVIWTNGENIQETKKFIASDCLEIMSKKMWRFFADLLKLEIIPKRFYNDMFTVWMRLINESSDVQAEFLKIPEIREAMGKLMRMSMDKFTRAEYEARIKEINDFHASNTTSYEKGKEAGKAEGIKKGREEGAREKALETAKNLLKAGIDINVISSAVGLFIEEVKKLQ